MSEKEEYYGIKFNDKIPKIDKVNRFRKEVEVEFEGIAYIVERDDDDEIVERTELENGDKLKKEKVYEIEFINCENQVYYLQVKIECSYLLFILLLFFLGFLIGLILTRPMKENSLLDKFRHYIDLAVIPLNIEKHEDEKVEQIENIQEIRKTRIIKRTKEEIEVIKKTVEIENQYNFDATFENISSDEINLTNTIEAKAVAKNKIAPGVSGSFAIVVSTKKSTVDMMYHIGFTDITNEKPNNMIFQIRGNSKQYATLQELQKDLGGAIEKNSKETIIIDWQWAYESGDNAESIMDNDKIDTDNSKKLNNYKFKINVVGEEAM